MSNPYEAAIALSSPRALICSAISSRSRITSSVLRRQVRRGPIEGLGRDQRVDAVERDPAVVADDPAAAVGVRQTGDDLGPAGRLDRRRVDVEDPGVVGLAVGGEDLLEVGIDRVAVGGQRVLDHPPAAVRHDRPLQRRVGLQTDDDLVGRVDVAGSVRGDGAPGWWRRCRRRPSPARPGTSPSVAATGRWCARSGRPGSRRHRCTACSCAGGSRGRRSRPATDRGRSRARRRSEYPASDRSRSGWTA